MQLDKPNGTIQNVNGASVFVNDFGQFRDSGAIIPGWNASSVVRPIEKAQQDAIRLHGDFAASIRKMTENADLTREAKKRQTAEEAGTYLAVIESALPALREAAQVALQVAQGQLLPAAPLKPEDAAQAIQDSEARSFLRGLDKQERSAIAEAMSRGEHPGIIGAVLRADAVLSGLSEGQRQHLAAAGIAQNHRRSVISLGMFSTSLRDLLFAFTTLANNLLSLCVEPGQALRGRVENWHSAVMPAINELFAFLKPIPVELPRQQTPEMANAAQREAEQEAERVKQANAA